MIELLIVILIALVCCIPLLLQARRIERPGSDNSHVISRAI